ncbi:MBL fold metallo-hydrolase [Chloroflexota bacterium]
MPPRAPIPITEVVKGIFKIGPLETHSRTPNTSPHLVVGEKQAAIVEFGESGQAHDLLEAIKEIGVDRDRIAYLIASHIHLHHIAGVDVLLKELPKSKMVIHQRGVRYVVEPTRLNESTFQAWGKDSGCPQIAPVPQDRIWGISGGEVIDLGGRELEVVETLGHSPHHIAIFDRLTKALFAGDAAGVLGLGSERASPDIRPPFFDVDLAAKSLQRLRALNPSAILLFGYGGISHSPQKTLQWSEEDIRTVERICREGMKNKESAKEIGRKVGEYYAKVGASMPKEGVEVMRERGIGVGGSLPIGMCAFLMKQDPSLEMPK